MDLRIVTGGRKWRTGGVGKQLGGIMKAIIIKRRDFKKPEEDGKHRTG